MKTKNALVFVIAMLIWAMAALPAIALLGSVAQAADRPDEQAVIEQMAPEVLTSCYIYAGNGFYENRPAVQTVCLSGTGEQRACGIFRSGALLIPKCGYWSPRGSYSYAIGPSGASVVSRWIEKRG
jgi:hypothetical protein